VSEFDTGFLFILLLMQLEKGMNHVCYFAKGAFGGEHRDLGFIGSARPTSTQPQYSARCCQDNKSV